MSKFRKMKKDKIEIYPLLKERRVNNFDVYFPPAEYWINKGRNIDTRSLIRGANIKEIDSVYIHFPFCPSKCRVCPYIKLKNKYLNNISKLIIDEIKIFRNTVKRKIKSNSLMFGGGTPNFIPTFIFEELLKELKKTFNLNKAKQIIMEVRPGIRYKEHISLLLKYFSPKQIHISIGLQSVKKEGIKFYRKPVKEDLPLFYNLDDIIDIINFCHKNGIRDINIDFMLRNLKEFTEEEKEIERLVKEKKVTKLTIYPVFIQFMERRNFVRPTPWGLEEMANLRKRVYRFMKRIGFVVGIWPNYFVKKGYVANYETVTQFKNTTLIGFGPSARSVVDSKNIHFYYENSKKPNTYINKIKKRLLGAEHVYIYPKFFNKRISTSILNLFLMKKIPPSIYKQIIKIGEMSGHKEEIRKLFKTYFKKDKRGYVFFNQKGFYVAEVVYWSLWEFMKGAFEKEGIKL